MEGKVSKPSVTGGSQTQAEAGIDPSLPPQDIIATVQAHDFTTFTNPSGGNPKIQAWLDHVANGRQSTNVEDKRNGSSFQDYVLTELRSFAASLEPSVRIAGSQELIDGLEKFLDQQALEEAVAILDKKRKK